MSELVQVGDVIVTTNVLGGVCRFPVTRVTKTLAKSRRDDGHEYTFQRFIRRDDGHEYTFQRFIRRDDGHEYTFQRFISRDMSSGASRWNSTKYQVEKIEREE